MTDSQGDAVEIAVIGAGPGGLSAAVRCAELGVSHVLLEASPAIANTLQKYQKGKHVMDEPTILPLRSPVSFNAGSRESILGNWQQTIESSGTHIRYGAEVVRIERQAELFRIHLSSAEEISARHVVLGVGIQGNPRRLDIPGGNSPIVQYQLDDPDEYSDETIVVIGAGDSAIENAVALSRNNKVYIVNRRDEFVRAKEGNISLMLSAIESGRVECFYNSVPLELELTGGGESAGNLKLNTATGEATVPVHRIIARLGAIPPRGLLESFGIEFPHASADAVPELSSQYESNVPGMYIIGSLAGYPLIKQAMNQGFEVVGYILGHDVKPADHELFVSKFRGLPFDLEVNDMLGLIQERIPVFREVNSLLFRELMLYSNVLTPAKGDVVFRRNDYTNTFFTILQGTVDIEINEELTISSGVGGFFGEMSLLSGRRRSATVHAGDDCILVETPRLTMNKLIASVAAVKRVLDETFIVRTIQQRFAPRTPLSELQSVAAAAEIHQYNSGDIIFREGDPGDTLHFVRSGSVTVSRTVGGREVIMAYLPANNAVGEMGVLGNTRRTATVSATVRTETISLSKDVFNQLLEYNPQLRAQLEATVLERHQQNVRSMQRDLGSGDLVSFLMSQGLGEATDVLLIDEDLCIGCDFCEAACAATHGGNSRLNRKAGPTYAHIHVPTSCRHCEDPHCMKECPPDAIHRGGVGGEVYISDNCIGCGNCEQNCPYGVIQMAHQSNAPQSFWNWMLFGLGEKPGKRMHGKDENAAKLATKCDMCKDLSGGPACVRSCPTGAAMRMGPEEFFELMRDNTVDLV